MLATKQIMMQTGVTCCLLANGWLNASLDNMTEFAGIT